MKTYEKDELQKLLAKPSFWNPIRTVNLFHYVAGIEGFDESIDPNSVFDAPNIADFEIYPNGLSINMMSKFIKYYTGILNEQILEMTLEDREQVYEKKEKSIVGRAVLGGLLFGPVGVVVGGMTGLKDRDKSKKAKMPDLFLSIQMSDEIKNERVLLFSCKYKHKSQVVNFFEKHYKNKFKVD